MYIYVHIYIYIYMYIYRIIKNMLLDIIKYCMLLYIICSYVYIYAVIFLQNAYSKNIHLELELKQYFTTNILLFSFW